MDPAGFWRLAATWFPKPSRTHAENKKISNKQMKLLGRLSSSEVRLNPSVAAVSPGLSHEAGLWLSAGYFMNMLFVQTKDQLRTTSVASWIKAGSLTCAWRHTRWQGCSQHLCYMATCNWEQAAILAQVCAAGVKAPEVTARGREGRNASYGWECSQHWRFQGLLGMWSIPRINRSQNSPTGPSGLS